MKKKALTKVKPDTLKMAAPVRPHKTTTLQPNSTNRFTPPKPSNSKPRPADEIQYDKSLVDGVKAQQHRFSHEDGAQNADVREVKDENNKHNLPGAKLITNDPDAVLWGKQSSSNCMQSARRTQIKPNDKQLFKGINSPTPGTSRSSTTPKPDPAHDKFQNMDNKRKLGQVTNYNTNSPASMRANPDGTYEVIRNKSLVEKSIVKNLFNQSSKMLLLCNKMLDQTSNTSIKSLLVDKMKQLAKELDSLETLQKSLSKDLREKNNYESGDYEETKHSRTDESLKKERRGLNNRNRPSKPKQEVRSDNRKTKLDLD